ncbi:hypothetical protein V6N13_132583 [Hibiscus sabdariffa]
MNNRCIVDIETGETTTIRAKLEGRESEKGRRTPRSISDPKWGLGDCIEDTVVDSKVVKVLTARVRHHKVFEGRDLLNRNKLQRNLTL